MRLSEKIPMLVRLRGTTQADLARAIGTYPSRVSEWVSERGSPSVQQAFRLAKALDVTLDYLADDGQDQPAVMPMTEREKQVWEMVLAIGADEAWRRLMQVPPESHPGAVLGSKLIRPPGAEDEKRKGAG